MSFDLLSSSIKKYIYEQGWEELRSIQVVAIEKIITTDSNYILASRTASGKTEAAFLPILSTVDFTENGVQVLYISPLIALINDQFERVENLCKYLDVTVTKWHGEANKTLKNKLLKQPNGIVLITPESLEAMFVNSPFNVKQLFSNLKYVVVDEVHSFIGTDRGIQLKSILSRLQNNFRIIGLSATIGDYDEAKKFTGNPINTKVLLDRKAKEINVVFRYFENKTAELSVELLQDLYSETKDSKALIFPNSRGRAEEVAVKLKKISARTNGHQNYFSHHSSVNKDIREDIEHFAKNNIRQYFCISCTSTLELGIDIGTVDKVVQIDATHSIASLIQRVGRSGRQDSKSSNLILYATDKWSLLQSLACWLLYKEGFIEPPRTAEKPYDILLHQALSIVKERAGINLPDLIKELQSNSAFSQIEISEIEEIINYLIETNLLEKLRNEVIIGIECEKIVNSRDFYSVFKAESNFKVIHSGNAIGEIPYSPQVIENENILLAARIWKIKYIDIKAKRIEVIPTNDGKKPMFFGSGATVHPKIREKMLEVLYSNRQYDFLDEKGCDEIESLRNYFSVFAIKNILNERPLLSKPNDTVEFYTFTGTKINRTLKLLFDVMEIKNKLDDESSSFEIEISKQELLTKWKNLYLQLENIDNYLLKIIETTPTIMDFSKFAEHLPPTYKLQLLKEKHFDTEGTKEFLLEINSCI